MIDSHSVIANLDSLNYTTTIGIRSLLNWVFSDQYYSKLFDVNLTQLLNFKSVIYSGKEQISGVSKSLVYAKTVQISYPKVYEAQICCWSSNRTLTFVWQGLKLCLRTPDTEMCSDNISSVFYKQTNSWIADLSSKKGNWKFDHNLPLEINLEFETDYYSYKFY